VLFAVLFAATMAGSLSLAALALAPGGFGIIDIMLLALFAVTLPWMVAGLWNAVIGFLIVRFSADPIAAAMPMVAQIRGDEPVVASTAILLCIRNELPERMIRNLEPMLAGLDVAGCGARFRLYVLSDTSDAGIAIAEQACFTALASSWRDRIGITTGAARSTPATRPATSVTSASAGVATTISRDARRRQSHAGRRGSAPRPYHAGQSASRHSPGLIVGLPSTSAFARIFQFGMRLGMRSYTIGSAWWQGDCGPYWGHNAVLRLAPFTAHCALPALSKEASKIAIS
jgi:membrane glycosyltransferase